MSKVTYIESKVNNTEDYGTHISIEIGLVLEEMTKEYRLVVTRKGCMIKEVDE